MEKTKKEEEVEEERRVVDYIRNNGMNIKIRYEVWVWSIQNLRHYWQREREGESSNADGRRKRWARQKRRRIWQGNEKSTKFQYGNECKSSITFHGFCVCWKQSGLSELRIQQQRTTAHTHTHTISSPVCFGPNAINEETKIIYVIFKSRKKSKIKQTANGRWSGWWISNDKSLH